MYGALDSTTSALVAQRTRMATIANNVANTNTLIDGATGEYAPYRRQTVVFASGDGAGNAHGVHVASIDDDMGPLQEKFMPGSPFADERGIVLYPNVHPIVEQMDAMEAYRSYEANIAAAEATKSMMGIALQLIA